MPSSFTAQEQVMFDDLVEGFDDMLVTAKLATKYDVPGAEQMARSRDQFWIPAPMIGSTYDGFDQTSNFGDLTETQIPVSIGYHKVDPRKFSAKDMRNQSALNAWGKAAKQKLASDINYALAQTVALQGSVTVKRTGAPTGYDDVSLADAALTEIGVTTADRVMLLSPRTYNAMAGDLAKRATTNGRDLDAYARAMIGTDIAGFDVFKNDTPITLTAATGGANLVNGANQYFTPAATTTDTLGVAVNIDNRYSTLVVDGGTPANIKAGDRFTIAGVNSVHMITKQDTGQLQTFTVISNAAGTLKVAPAIISNGGGTRAEKEYQNVSATPADNAAITWLNTTTAQTNPFWVRDSLLLLPGSYSVDPDDGWQVLRATTDAGIAITYTRQGEINDLSVKARFEVDFGTALTAPMTAGIELFGQA